ESPLRHLYGLVDWRDWDLGRVAAVLPVHQMGAPFPLGRILAVARAFRLPVVEDAACAVGSELSENGGETWERIGRPHGDVACFSFHPRKILTTGDGGMLTTESANYDAQFRLLRHHGMSVSDADRHISDEVIIESYLTTGFNYRMTDLQAAVGIEQLKKIDGILRERRALAERYGELLAGVTWLETPEADPFTRPNWQSYPVRLGGEAKGRQDELLGFLRSRGISARPGIMNSHEELAYAAQRWRLPESEKARAETVLLPLYPGMTEEEIRHVADSLRSFQAG
ncbi:MAG: DegT/DnrJ/EryC1/StrS family aminotransferase, partial [Vicinamibacteria bacterium]